MAEDPEEMHPQDGGTAGLGIEEVRAEEAVEREHDLGGRERRDGEENHGAHDQVEPDQERHFAEGHARAAETDDGSDKVDGGADAAESRDKQAEGPEIGAVADRKCLCGEWSVSKPADVRRAAGTIKTVATDETEIQEQAAERGEPETPGVEAGKGHVARADHQRDKVIAEAEEYRHGDEENHGGAMHGEHAIESLRGNEMIVGNDELDAHDGGFDAADHEEKDGVEDVEDAEALVVNSGDPGVEQVAERARGRSCGSEGDGFRGHRLWPRSHGRDSR